MRAAYSLSHIIVGKLKHSEFSVPDYVWVWSWVGKVNEIGGDQTSFTSEIFAATSCPCWTA